MEKMLGYPASFSLLSSSFWRYSVVNVNLRRYMEIRIAQVKAASLLTYFMLSEYLPCSPAVCCATRLKKDANVLFILFFFQARFQ